MKEIDLDELKQIQINITKEVHKFCKEKGLRYSLTYGTLIGAIRHNGFIPWDDDIDILMPRPDFEIFKRSFKHQFIVVADKEINPECNVTYGKVYDSRTVIQEYASIPWCSGVYIDVFPIDGLGNNYENAVKHYKKLTFLRHLRDFKMVKLSRSRSFFRNLVLLLGKIALLPISFNFLQYKTIELCKKYRFEDSKYAAELSFGTYKRIISKEVFENYVSHIFENENFYIIKKYDDYLKNVFGDYMKLPPQNEQKTHHVFKAWWK